MQTRPFSRALAHAHAPLAAQDLERRKEELLRRRASLVEELRRRTRALFADPSAAPWAALARVDDEASEDEDAEDASERLLARSLSASGERRAAAAVALEATIPWSGEAADGPARARFADAASAPVDDGGDEDEGPTVRSSLDGDWNDLDGVATLRAIGLESGSDPRSAAAATRRRSARVAETPLPTRDGADDAGRGEVDADVRGRALRFSAGMSLEIEGEEVERASARAETSDGPALDVRVVDGAPVRVFFGAAKRTSDEMSSAIVGVVVESSDGEAADALVFRVGGGDENGSATKLLGSCCVRDRAEVSRRASRRRSSISTELATAAFSPDAVCVSPRGRFVFAPAGDDGVRVLLVHSPSNDGDDVRPSASASRTPKRKKLSEEVNSLACGFRVTRLAATFGDRGRFLLAAAGEQGRCVVWSWSSSEVDDDNGAIDDDPDRVLFNAPATFDEMPSATYRGVAPNPGAPTSLHWIGDETDLRLVIVVDQALTCVWDTSEKSRERSSYDIARNIKTLVPVRCADIPHRTGSEAPLAALALAQRKRDPLAGLDSERTLSESPASIEVEFPCEVGAAFIRPHGVSVGSALFPSGAEDACALACSNDRACLGTRSGTFIAWNIITGERVFAKKLAAIERSGDAAASSVACANGYYAACARDRVLVFAEPRDASRNDHT